MLHPTSSGRIGSIYTFVLPWISPPISVCLSVCLSLSLYIYIQGSLNRFPDVFRMGTFIDSTHMKLLFPSKSSPPAAMHLLYRSNNFWKAPWKSSCVSVSIHSSQPLSSPQFSHNDREGEQLSWCPSWSNSLWQGWSCGLVHFPAGNATDPIWRVLASNDGISSWTSLKPQHSNPNPNPLANQLWCIDFLTPPTPIIILHRLPAFLESPMPQKPMLDLC